MFSYTSIHLVIQMMYIRIIYTKVNADIFYCGFIPKIDISQIMEIIDEQFIQVMYYKYKFEKSEGTKIVCEVINKHFLLVDKSGINKKYIPTRRNNINFY